MMRSSSSMSSTNLNNSSGYRELKDILNCTNCVYYVTEVFLKLFEAVNIDHLVRIHKVK